MLVGVGVALSIGVDAGVASIAMVNSGADVEVGASSESPHAATNISTIAKMKVRKDGNLRVAVIIALIED